MGVFSIIITSNLISNFNSNGMLSKLSLAFDYLVNG